jgi:hypothetical protein
MLNGQGWFPHRYLLQGYSIEPARHARCGHARYGHGRRSAIADPTVCCFCGTLIFRFFVIAH